MDRKINLKQPRHKKPQSEIEYLDEEFLQAGTDEDTAEVFYPNAVSCLLSLYKEKLKSIRIDSVRAENVWLDISNEMNDSFFHFNASQVQSKFKQLRARYFSIRTPEDAESFDYFIELHDIYQDRIIDAFANSQERTLQLKRQRRASYQDDFLFRDGTRISKEPKFDTGYVEKVDRSMKPIRPQPTNANALQSHKIENIKGQETLKRLERHCSTDSSLEIIGTDDVLEVEQKNKDMTLAEYNEHQERRHRELMAFKQKSLRMRSETMEVQRQLLELLVKQNT